MVSLLLTLDLGSFWGITNTSTPVRRRIKESRWVLKKITPGGFGVRQLACIKVLYFKLRVSYSRQE